MTHDSPARSPLARLPLLLATLWLLTGAGFKLFLGTPNDLPPMVKDLPLALGLTYQLAIGIELVFVVLALTVPRLGWIAIAAIYVLFELLLAQLASSGADSCGCFGSKVTLSPKLMMTIDGVLLGLLLLSRPWKGARPGLNKFLVAILCVASFALPFLFSREVKLSPKSESNPNTPAVAKDATATKSTQAKIAETLTKPFTILAVDDWVGQLIYDTPLVELIEQDISSLPTEGRWIFWRADCSHCAEHLQLLATDPPDEPFLTLIQLKQSTDTDENREVHTLPTGPTVVEASLPATYDYAITTPAELHLEGAVIVSAEEGVGD